MVSEPGYWQKYYHGDEDAKRLQRHFSYSDRIRYYWPTETATAAVESLLARLKDREIPAPLISQYLPRLYSFFTGQAEKPNATDLIIESIRLVIRDYEVACRRI